MGSAIFEPTEREVQTCAIKALRKLGFTVITTSSRKVSDNTRGCPDAFVHILYSIWVGIEFKRPSGKLSEEQKELNDAGKIFICRNTDEAIDVAVNALKRVRKSEKHLKHK